MKSYARGDRRARETCDEMATMSDQRLDHLAVIRHAMTGGMRSSPVFARALGITTAEAEGLMSSQESTTPWTDAVRARATKRRQDIAAAGDRRDWDECERLERLCLAKLPGSKGFTPCEEKRSTMLDNLLLTLREALAAKEHTIRTRGIRYLTMAAASKAVEEATQAVKAQAKLEGIRV